MAVRTTKTKGEALIDIKNLYVELGNGWPATARDIAAWAIREGYWEPQPALLLDKCAKEMAEALGEEYFTDPQGRRVRKNHVARVTRQGKQLSLWADIRTAPTKHMEKAFGQRRNQIVGECRQLKTDLDCYNDLNPDNVPIQLVFDFSEDIEESLQPIEYRPNQPR